MSTSIRPVDALVGKSGGLIPVCLNGKYITLPVGESKFSNREPPVTLQGKSNVTGG